MGESLGSLGGEMGWEVQCTGHVTDQVTATESWDNQMDKEKNIPHKTARSQVQRRKWGLLQAASA